MLRTLRPYIISAAIVQMGTILVQFLWLANRIGALSRRDSGGLDAASVGLTETLPYAVAITVLVWAVIFLRQLARRRRKAIGPLD